MPDLGSAIAQHRRSVEEKTQQRERVFGSVKWFNPDKGYGFLTPDSRHDVDIFIHARECESAGISTVNLTPGTRISYEVTIDRGRPQASALKRE